MEILRRDEREIRFSEVLTWEKIKEIEVDEDFFFWHDLYVYHDLIDTNPRVAYIYDARQNTLFYGYLPTDTFIREPDPDTEKEILEKSLGVEL